MKGESVGVLMRSGVLSLLLPLTLCAFDWKPQPNEELRRAALERARAFARAFADRPESRAALAFVAAEEHSQDPGSWIGACHGLARQILALHPPAAGDGAVREEALRLRDYPLHVDNFNPATPAAVCERYADAARAYLNGAKTNVLAGLAAEPAGEGVAIWKLYNMGFVVKGKRRAFAIDLASGPVLSAEPPADTRPLWTDAEVDRLTDALDALFITHPHGDHYHAAIVASMLKKGKPVVRPCPFAMPGLPAAAAGDPNLITLHDFRGEPAEVAGLRVTAFPGRQDERTPCSVFVIEADGVRIAHNGDNTDASQYALFRRVPPVNVILANNWSGTRAYALAAAGVAGADRVKQLLITGHENELGHSVPHRESFWETFRRLGDRGTLPACVVMDCGERVRYPAPAAAGQLQ